MAQFGCQKELSIIYVHGGISRLLWNVTEIQSTRRGGKRTMRLIIEGSFYLHGNCNYCDRWNTKQCNFQLCCVCVCVCLCVCAFVNE